jgi:hypothetical protein
MYKHTHMDLHCQCRQVGRAHAPPMSIRFQVLTGAVVGSSVVTSTSKGA